jgi:NAD(P)-dependent dehydrogenase (short-subunit alcohol dehydrogenase family)
MSGRYRSLNARASTTAPNVTIMASPSTTPTDLTGRVAVVTGANSGLGLEVARDFAVRGATVVMAVRGMDRAEQAAADLGAATGSPRISGVALDLADLDAVAHAAAQLTERLDRIDLLINNAGVMMLPSLRTTAQGVEMQMGTNHLGHFALTGRLLPLIRDVEGSRIVTVSSGAHKMLRPENAQDLWSTAKYSATGAYAASKSANLLFCFELERRLRAAGAATISVAAHPGLAATNLQTSGPAAEGLTMSVRVMELANRTIAQSAARGAAPIIAAATASSVRGGDYFGPGGPLELRGAPKRVKTTNLVRDRALAEQVWAESERLCGSVFDLPPAP